MRQRSLLSLPLDIIHLIIESIDEPSDLLRVALTSKSLHHLITSDPSHLRYRRIQCGWRQTKIWSLLKQDVGIASRVRVLELPLAYRSSEQWTAPLSPTLTAVDKSVNWKDIVELFKDALTNMVNLTEFSCGTLVPVDLIGDDILELCLDIALCHKDVRELIINHFQAIVMMNPSSSRLSHSPRAFLNNLTRICVTFNTVTLDGVEISTITPSGEKVVQVIVDRCPNLEDLSLGTEVEELHPYCSALRIFAEGHWPNLRRLALFGGIFCLPENTDTDAKSAILNAFWKRHPNLECLVLRPDQEHKLDIQSGVLPKLKSLSGFLNPVVSAVAVDVLPRIKHMCDYTTDLLTPRFPISYFKHTTSLTSLILMELDEEWEQLLSNHPTITRFALCQKLMPKDLSIDDEYQRGLSRLNALTSLPSLTHLYLRNVCFREPFEYMSYLSSFPKLKYIAGLRSDYEWNVLERDDEGRVIRWQPPEEALIESLESFEDWGCDLKAAVGGY